MENTARIIVGDSRNMSEIKDGEVDLVITSPPYWHIKDYGAPGQIGYNQSLHEYLKDLYRVWCECYRVVRDGGRICINIGDQFARAIIYGRYKVMPLHAEVISQCERIGLDYMGSIIWQKKTTMNTTGGATIMGSFPYPPNGIVEIDYEFILIFKKPGENKKVSKEIKEASILTRDEWKEYFSGHWYFGGVKQSGHEAMFPEELPRRLIKMFTFTGDTVLDPFLGSGTTAKAALGLNRNAVGYEINGDFTEIIREKIGLNNRFSISKQNNQEIKLLETDYTPSIQDAKPVIDPKKFNFEGDHLYRVSEVIDELTLRLNTGLTVRLPGIKVENKDDTINYLKNYVLGKEIILKLDGKAIDENSIEAYIYLKNKIFINEYLIKSGLASPDESVNHDLKKGFFDYQNKTVL